MSFVVNEIPQNDEQLNLLIASMNRAYGKYFDFAVSEKRSNKLRDCICEGLGFTNGGYQQLRSYWSASSHYDFTNPELVVGLQSELTLGLTAVIAKSFAWPLMPFLCTYFPAEDGQFCDADSLPDGAEFQVGSDCERYGWEMVDFQSVGQAHAPKQNLQLGNWFPLYYGQYIVGYSFAPDEAEMLNGILLAAKMNGLVWSEQTIPSAGNAGSAWKAYIEDVDKQGIQFERPEKYLSLRMSGMDLGLVVPFDEIMVSATEMVVSKGGDTVLFNHSQKDDTVIFNEKLRLGFDFCSAYGKSLSVQSGEQELSGRFEFDGPVAQGIGAVEWFAGDRVEIMPVDGDCDDMIVRSYNAKNTADKIC